MGHGKNSKGEFKSQVPHVMLHLNPGVARHYGSQVRTLDKLKNKVVILNCLKFIFCVCRRPKYLQNYDKGMGMGKHTFILTINIYS